MEAEMGDGRTNPDIDEEDDQRAEEKRNRIPAKWRIDESAANAKSAESSLAETSEIVVEDTKPVIPLPPSPKNDNPQSDGDHSGGSESSEDEAEAEAQAAVGAA